MTRRIVGHWLFPSFMILVAASVAARFVDPEPLFKWLYEHLEMWQGYAIAALIVLTFIVTTTLRSGEAQRKERG